MSRHPHAIAASAIVRQTLARAAQVLGAEDPAMFVGPLLDRSFPDPVGTRDYGANTLTPGAVPVEPSYSEQEHDALRVTIEPLSGASPSTRIHEASREMRRLVHQAYGDEALRWFDRWSEEWRTAMAPPQAAYGAWLGVAVDGDGLAASKIYYELQRGNLDALPPRLRKHVLTAVETLPGLIPLFTSIRCGRLCGVHRVTLLHTSPLRLTDLRPLLDRLGLGHQLPGLMQIVGLALGGRFELPRMSVMLGLSDRADGAELKFEVALGMIPDLPRSFMDLLGLALAERPRELRGLQRWLSAFSSEDAEWPGQFSVMSVKITPTQPARVSVYLRPIQFELTDTTADRTEAAAMSA